MTEVNLRRTGMGISSFIIIPQQMLNRLTFFKPMGPNQPEIGQSWYQSTPLYLYIQNVKLFFD